MDFGNSIGFTEFKDDLMVTIGGRTALFFSEAMTAQLAEPVIQDYPDRKTVIVTGFAPFGGHEVNASWESVKLLKETELENELGVELVVEEIPVTYCVVEEKVPELWRKHKPLLVVHVGVSQMATCLNIEKCAQRAGYERPDEDKSKPSCGKGCLCSLSTEETEDCIHTNIDVTKLCEEVNKLNSDVKTLVSDNAGRYLCEYIYYASLSMDCARTVFVHVPPLDVYTKHQICGGLADIIRLLVKELQDDL